MEKLLNILHEINPSVDFENETGLVEKHILDSLSIVMLVSDLQDAFNVTITPVDILPENFDSAETILKMIASLGGDI